MTSSQIESYRHRISPHYKAICADAKVQAINAKRELSLFCTQWGNNWKCGEDVLFIGRATNGWGGGLDADAILSSLCQ